MAKVEIIAKVIPILFDHCSDLLALEDAEGKLQRVSTSWNRMLGWSEAELIGAPIKEIFRMDDPDFPERECLARRGNIRHQDGQWLRVSWTCVALSGEMHRLHVGRLAGAEERPLDNEATSSPNLAKQEESRAEETLAHELRAALHGVLGGLALLAKEPRSQAEQEALDLAHQSAEHMRSVIEQTLHNTATTGQERSFVERPFELPPLLRDLVEICQAHLSPASPSITLCMEPGLDRQRFLGDATWVRLILLGVMQKVARISSSRIVILSAQKVSGGVLFEVTAQAPKMKEEDLPQGFLPRARRRTGPRFEDNDEELSIARGLVRLLGGVLLMASRPGQGITARVSLPLPLEP